MKVQSNYEGYVGMPSIGVNIEFESAHDIETFLLYGLHNIGGRSVSEELRESLILHLEKHDRAGSIREDVAGMREAIIMGIEEDDKRRVWLQKNAKNKN